MVHNPFNTLFNSEFSYFFTFFTSLFIGIIGLSCLILEFFNVFGMKVKQDSHNELGSISSSYFLEEIVKTVMLIIF